MALELTCSNISLPDLPPNNASTDVPSHSSYNPNGRALAQLISSSLSRSTFSIENVRSFLKEITSINSWDASTIVKMKPVTSTIIYLSISLALFLVLSLVFCIISCNKCCKRKGTDHRRKRRKCSGQCISVVIIFLVVLLIIAQMIYISYQVNRTKIFLDDSLRVINEEIYPKEISDYLNHLINQFKQLNQYSRQSNFV